MSIDSRHDVQAQIDHTMLLKQLLDRSRASEEATALIASQLGELNRTVVSIMERDAAPAAVMCPSTSPPAATPGPSPFRAKRVGAPGTFRPPARVPVTKSASINEFHVSFYSLCSGDLCVN